MRTLRQPFNCISTANDLIINCRTCSTTLEISELECTAAHYLNKRVISNFQLLIRRAATTIRLGRSHSTNVCPSQTPEASV
jgi:hypothetical protein